MREIKFRFWNQMDGMVYPDNLSYRNGTWTAVSLTSENFYAVNTLMQYTGLKDKNGKEIYEGDIVGEKWVQKNIDKDGEHFTEKISPIFVVEYHGCGFIPFAYSQFGDEGIDEDRVEIIGNVFEHPELTPNSP